MSSKRSGEPSSLATINLWIFLRQSKPELNCFLPRKTHAPLERILVLLQLKALFEIEYAVVAIEKPEADNAQP